MFIKCRSSTFQLNPFLPSVPQTIQPKVRHRTIKYDFYRFEATFVTSTPRVVLFRSRRAANLTTEELVGLARRRIKRLAKIHYGAVARRQTRRIRGVCGPLCPRIDANRISRAHGANSIRQVRFHERVIALVSGPGNWQR